MGKAQARVATAATLVAVYAAWHFTAGMHGAVLRVHTTPAAAAITTAAITTSQCQPLAAAIAASPSASAPASTAEASQLCVSVQAAQDSVRSGTIADWTIQIQDQNGPASSVTVSLAASVAGLTPVFTASCPSGAGTTTCSIGDMGTAVTPSSYQLQAQLPVPATTAARTVTFTASADTSPSMGAAPAAGQTIAITVPPPVSKPTPASTVATEAPTQAAATAPVVTPTIAPVTMPAIADPTSDPATATIPAGSVATVLPQVTPAVATAPAPASSPVANIAVIGTTPSAVGGTGSFSLSIGMSGQTAQTLGLILLALIVTLIVTRLVSSWLSHSRPPAHREAATGRRKLRIKLPRWRLPALRLPRLRLRIKRRPARAERRAAREQNWERHLASEQDPAVVDKDLIDGLPPQTALPLESSSSE